MYEIKKNKFKKWLCSIPIDVKLDSRLRGNDKGGCGNDSRGRGNDGVGVISPYAEKLEALSYFFAIAIAFVLPISTFLTNVFFISAIVLYFAAGNIKSKLDFVLHNKIALLFIIFCGFFLIGLFYTTAPLINAIKVFYKYADKFLYGALLFPIFRSEKLQKYGINAFIGAMLLVLALSYLNYFHVLNLHFSAHQDEVFKSHIETNFLMAFVAYMVMQKISQSVRYRWPLIVALLLFIIYIFLDAGRSGYFVFIALSLLFLWQKFSWKGLLGAFVTIMCLTTGAYLFSSTFHQRVDAIRSDVVSYHPGTVTSVGARMDFVKNSVELIKRNPYFGTGTGSFGYEYKKVNPAVPPTDNPHNEFIYIWVQFGAFGVALLLWIFGMQLYQGRKLSREQKELAQALVVSFVVGCLANSWLADTTQGHFFVYLSAIIFAALPTKSLLKS
jgi:O-antigen ligase